jgi:hypothetical protein
MHAKNVVFMFFQVMCLSRQLLYDDRRIILLAAGVRPSCCSIFAMFVYFSFKSKVLKMNWCQKVAEMLQTQGRWDEAAVVLRDYVGNIEESVVALVRGSQWSEALRLARDAKRDDLVETLVVPGAFCKEIKFGPLR